MPAQKGMTQVERWDIFELSLEGPQDGNPFVDVSFDARFSHEGRVVEVAGFYDGDGVYRVRFMPDTPGPWSYVTTSDCEELDGVAGQFTCTTPGLGNHGPVRVSDTYHFAYADGSPYFPIGTTCYAWTHQGDALEEETLETLKIAPFNKMRMCVFPKHYLYNENEPVYHAFERTESGEWDYARFNPDFFRHLEQRIGDLRDLGIEADLVLFHPYDRWGYAVMDAETDDRYLRYIVARLAAYRNVWWSLANEYDLMMQPWKWMVKAFDEKTCKRLKSEADWDHIFQLIQTCDPYQHLRSIHNGPMLYNHTLPWVTHASIQDGPAVADFGRAAIYRRVYRKPIVFDEVGYEGNVPQRWGSRSAEEMVHRFWQGTIGGTYVGHGETYLHPEDILWWAKGGVLHGKSPTRIAFLREILEQGPPLAPVDPEGHVRVAGVVGEYYLVYFGKEQPVEWLFELPCRGLDAGAQFQVEIIDTWEMTITPVEGIFEVEPIDRHLCVSRGDGTINLPGKPYIALRLRKVA
jgi:hypothetical protein